MTRWTIKPIGEILLTLETGSRPKGGVDGILGGIPSLGGEHINRDGGFNWEKIRYVTRDFFLQMQRGHIRCGDILVVKDGATTGKIAIVRNDFPFHEAAINEHVFLLRTDQTKALPKFVGYYLFSPVGQQQILSCFRGAAIGGIPRDFVKFINIPLPSLLIQERIVKLLDEADEMRKLRGKADRRTAELIPALFHDMFESRGFSPVCLGELTTLVTSGLTPRGGESIYLTSGPYFIRSQNVQMNRLTLEDAVCLPLNVHKQMDRTRVTLGDVLLNITGASIGRVAWVDKLEREANVSQHVCLMRPKPDLLVSVYLSVFLSMPRTQKYILQVQAGASRQALNHQQVRRLEIPLPPLMMQKQFADRVLDIRNLEADQAASRISLDALFQSMLHHAFNGEL